MYRHTELAVEAQQSRDGWKEQGIGDKANGPTREPSNQVLVLCCSRNARMGVPAAARRHVWVYQASQKTNDRLQDLPSSVERTNIGGRAN
jgi:hypothetical protein